MLSFFRILFRRISHTMAVAVSEEKFLHITNHSEFFPVVKEELQKRSSIYGNQESWIEKVEKRSDRSCELLLKKAKPVTLLIYKTEPVTKSEKIEVTNSLEIKTFFPIENNSSTVENLKKTLDRALEVAREKKAKNIHLTCSEREKQTFKFLVNNDFQVCETWDGKYVDGVKEFMMYKSVEKVTDGNKVAENNAKESVCDKILKDWVEEEGKSNDVESSQEKDGKKTENETKNRDERREKDKSGQKRHFNDSHYDRDDHKRSRHDEKKDHSSRANERGCSSKANERGNSSKDNGKEFDSCTLMKKYIYLIRDGRKTVEARLNVPMFQKWREGTIVRFHCRGPVDVHVKITEIKHYKSFRTMLEQEGYRNCVPDVHSLNEAVQAYLRIPRYKEREHLGVLAFRIQKVDPPRR